MRTLRTLCEPRDLLRSVLQYRFLPNVIIWRLRHSPFFMPYRRSRRRQSVGPQQSLLVALICNLKAEFAAQKSRARRSYCGQASSTLETFARLWMVKDPTFTSARAAMARFRFVTIKVA